MDSKFIIKKIKDKKELSGITDEIVKNLLENYSKKNQISFSNLNSSDLKIIVKDIRAELRNYVGRFNKSVKDREKMLEKNDILSLLRTHSSTAERINFYPGLRENILSLKPKSILDIGCGLNPIALASKDIFYYACDINENDLKIVSEYFRKNKIRNKTFVFDIRKLEFSKLPRVDICLMMKLLDFIDDKKHTLTKLVLREIRCKYLLVSFSTKKLSGKPMNFPRRKWFDRLLKKLKLNSEVSQSENEIFYIIKKSS